MTPARVGPTGMTEPGDMPGAARAYPRWLRLLATFLVGAFVAATVASTVGSRGAYCLTTHGGDRPSVRRRRARRGRSVR